MEAEALQAFFDKVNTLSALPVAMPNVHADLTEDHLRVTVTNIDPERRNVCSGKSVYKWIVQIVVAVKEGVGAITAAEQIDSLKAGLPFNTILTSDNYEFRTTNNGITINPLNSSNGWYLAPVQFTFETVV